MKRLALLAATACLGLTIAGCGGGSEPAPPPVTITETASAAPSGPVSSAAPVPVPVVLPEVEGRNLQLVAEELNELGLTNVNFASQDVEDKVVLLPTNWTAVSIEPAAGTEVLSTDTVVVTATKES